MAKPIRNLIIVAAAILFIPMFLLSAEDGTKGQAIDPNPMLGQYSKGKILTNDYDKIEAEDICIYNDYAVFTDSRSMKQKKMTLDQLAMINVRTGSFWLEGMLIGAVGGLVLPLAYGGDGVTAEVVGCSTLLFSGVGLLVGLSMSRNKTIYQSGTLLISGTLPPGNCHFHTDYASHSIINFNIPLN